jgi:hypothetical protein
MQAGILSKCCNPEKTICKQSKKEFLATTIKWKKNRKKQCTISPQNSAVKATPEIQRFLIKATVSKKRTTLQATNRNKGCKPYSMLNKKQQRKPIDNLEGKKCMLLKKENTKSGIGKT